MVPILDSSSKKVQPLKKTKLLPDSDDEDEDSIMQDVSKSSRTTDGGSTRLNQGMELMRLFDDPTSVYVASDADTFLIPLIDRWVWGTTVTNESRRYWFLINHMC